MVSKPNFHKRCENKHRNKCKRKLLVPDENGPLSKITGNCRTVSENLSSRLPSVSTILVRLRTCLERLL